MFPGNDKHPDWMMARLPVLTGRTGILQTQRGYQLDGNKQPSDNIHRKQTSGHGPGGASQPSACLASLKQNTGRQEVAGD